MLVDVVYRFVRRAVQHYGPEKNKWVKSLFHVSFELLHRQTMTLIRESIF